MAIACALARSLMLATAANYYIDFPAGSDANNGTATNTAWQHCPGDAKATGIPATTPLAAGDTVIFRGGVSYTNSITVNWSGAVGNPITYDGNSAGTWGSGEAILDGEYLLPTNTVPGYWNYEANFILLNRANVAIKNFQIQHAGGLPLSDYSSFGYPTNPLPRIYGYGAWLVSDTNILIHNCLFQEMGYWTNSYPVNTDITGQDGWGVQIFSGINITVTNCQFYRIPRCIAINAGYPAAGTVCSNIVISSCDFSHYINWMLTVSPSSPSVTLGNILITNNTFHDAWETTGSYWWGGGTNANGGGGWPHFDGIFMGIANLPNIVYTNIVVAANTFYWDSTNGGGTAWIFLENMGGDVSILNNVCLNGYNSYGFIFIMDGPYFSNNVTPINFKIYNNTIADPQDAVCVRWQTPGTDEGNGGSGSDPSLGQIRIKNNILYTVNPGCYRPPINFINTSNGPTELDYNDYHVSQDYSQDTLLNWTTNHGATTLGTLSANLAGTRVAGYEIHGIEADPLFINPVTNTAKFPGYLSTSDLHLQTNSPASPAIGAGVNLSAIFTTDKDGVLRSTNGLWDIGAYDPAVETPRRPTGLHIIGP